eukprot:TRINITY_DN13594_c0_g1_i1.p1 TRINITY_DN13594_c0_g1~~TRINITY_DN13594_c0_g1_i1.p1  ORF type:complete len:201 (+),score=47.45 TRINITY_DN13594_c0_g1_i1:83-685(+)
MSFVLPALPFSLDALAPYMSHETLKYHWGKHHAGYVAKLNELAQGTELAKKTLEEIILTEKGKAFNLGTQIWNHTFFWNCLSPKGAGLPIEPISDAIEKKFGSFDSFKKQFEEAATTHFGSGWVWLVKGEKQQLEIVSTHDAGNPLTQNKIPLLTCDVWEHAYYIDHRNDKMSYMKAYWNLVNWDFVSHNYRSPKVFSSL